MKRHLLISVAVLGLLAASAAGRASAQGYPYYQGAGQAYPYYQRPLLTYPRPALSPYLDLLRGGNRAANYYLGTLPELDRRMTNMTFGSAILGLDRRLGALAEFEGLDAPLAQTGHPAYFGNYGSYYYFGPAQRSPAAAPPVPASGRRTTRGGQ